jgi:hypothetical protein
MRGRNLSWFRALLSGLRRRIRFKHLDCVQNLPGCRSGSELENLEKSRRVTAKLIVVIR